MKAEEFWEKAFLAALQGYAATNKDGSLAAIWARDAAKHAVEMATRAGLIQAKDEPSDPA